MADNKTRITFSGITILALLVLVALMWVAAVEEFLRHIDVYSDYLWIGIARLLVILLGGVAISLAINRIVRHGAMLMLSSLRSFLPIRLFLYAFLLTGACTTTLVALGLLDVRGFDITSFTNSLLLGLLALWMYLATRYLHILSENPTGVLRLLDIFAINIMLTLILAEFALRQVSQHFPGPFIYNPSSIIASIEANRQPSGMRYLNFNLNSHGYNDEEFFVAKSDDLVVALLSDSFGFGIVPYQYNFATVAEKKLIEDLNANYNRIAIHNYGIPAIGMREYGYLLETEVERYRPNIVLLAVFVGNDITSYFSSKMDRASWKSFYTWWVYKLPSRIWLANTQVDAKRTTVNNSLADKLLYRKSPPIDNPELEIPTFNDEKYLEIERSRAIISDATSKDTAQHYRIFFSSMDRIKDKLGDRLAVVIIPDEFQVNDALYDKVLLGTKNASNYIRDYPQRRINTYCQSHKLACLDLLPVMRKAHAVKRVYHRNDSHWNARGNGIAGNQIALFVSSILKKNSSIAKPR